MLTRRLLLVSLVALSGCAKRSNLAASATRIQLRMSEAQVEAILGAPTGSMLGGSDQDAHDVTYGGGSDVVHVLFLRTPDYTGVAVVNANGKQILSNSGK